MVTDMISRTVQSAIMRGARRCLTAVVLLSLLLGVRCGHHRRSMASPTTLPLTKGGWRPVINSGLPGYGAFVAAPLHAPSYKIPVPVMDAYPSQSRPVPSREALRASSPAQPQPSRPTTHRSLVASSQASPAPNQPIHTYYNPFSVPNSLTHYNFVQSYPVEKIIIRNPHNPYAARPIYTKHQNKFKQNYHNQMMQQLNNIQPIQFGAPVYPTHKPHDVFGKPVEGYARPGDFQKKPPPNSGTEIFKQEVYKLPDSDTAPQSVNQQVKTAQQQQNTVANPQTNNQFQSNQYQQYPQYQFKDEKFAPIPSSVLGTFNNFGVQTVKGRDPFYQPTKTTYIPTLPPKHTLFNSYSYSPHFKSTLSVSQFPSTTPKLQSTLNHIQFGTTVSDYKPTSDQSAKIPNNVKTEPNTGKFSFKPSPQDPFIKYQVSTYNPNAQTSTVDSFFNNYQTQSPQNVFYDTPTFSFENKKQKIHDSLGSSVNQQQSSVALHKKPEPESPKKPAPHRPTYEVTEVYEQDDIKTQASPNPWVTPETFDFLSNQQKPATEDSVTSPDYTHNDAYRKQTQPPHDPSDEYAIVTESDKGYGNSLHYDDSIDTQNIKPVKEELEPIGKHKLKDYYYRVTTPTYEETTHYKRFKNRPTEPSDQYQDLTTIYNSNKNDSPGDALPTLPPNKHFKRPNAPDSNEKDKLKKRLKNRRRRPLVAKLNRNKEEQSSSESSDLQTKRPRVRVPKPKPQESYTTPTLNDDVASSAVPTITPTTPTIVKKKIIHRHRPHTTSHDKVETTPRTSSTESGDDKESPIMKIANRPHHPRSTTASYDNQSNETPDYSHKQDEKDTPTSDIAVNLSDNQRNKPEHIKHFSFHRDSKPIEANIEPVRYQKETTTESITKEETTTNLPNEEITTTATTKTLKHRLKTKYDSNRPKFSVKDYRSRLSSTTTTEKSSESHVPKLRFPQRRLPFENKNKNENETTERKKFISKDPRHRNENTNDEQTENETHPTRQPYRSRQSTSDTTEAPGTTHKISSRIRNGVRRKPAEETTENANPTTIHLKRPLRKKVKDSELGESVQDVAVTETTQYERDDSTSERTRSESAIMKIAKDDKKHHNDALDHIFEHSKRVSDLTLAATKDYNTPGKFKTVSPNSRRIPNYFTIATDDPILPIEAFFPQLNQKKES